MEEPETPVRPDPAVLARDLSLTKLHVVDFNVTALKPQASALKAQNATFLNPTRPQTPCPAGCEGCQNSNGRSVETKAKHTCRAMCHRDRRFRSSGLLGFRGSAPNPRPFRV